MDKTQVISTESLKENAKNWNLSQWTDECSLLSQNQLVILAPLTTPLLGDKAWKEKIHQLYLHLSSNEAIKAFGEMLNSSQVIEIMHFVKENYNDIPNRQKLSSLFVGLLPSVFKEVLELASDKNLHFLQEEAVTEVIQHNLSLILGELDLRFTDFCNRLSTKERELEKTELQEMNKEEILNLYLSIENFQQEGKNILHQINRALGIAWNTNRMDLIQELGRLKELCQKILINVIGEIANEKTSSSGFGQILNKKIALLFSDQDTNGNRMFMKDSTPALEALVKFAVWNLQDYREAGLLPEIKVFGPNDEGNASFKNREQLFLTAENNLKKIGLETLLDIKTARIYSKKALIEYISAFQNKLLN